MLKHHAYYSSACHHGRHSDCRHLCRYCGEPCICNCHRLQDLSEAFSEEEPDTLPETRGNKP